MSFVNYNRTGMRGSRIQVISSFLLILPFSMCLPGCSDEANLPSAEQLAQFLKAGPQPPRVDLEHLKTAKIGGGPYRVVPSEVIELTMPAVLQTVTAAEPEITGNIAPYVCRISEAGTVTLPVVGEIAVAGKTLAEIESAVTDAYHPEYTVTRPSVYARILEYKTARVTISGAVKNPGVYALRSDQMSLVALLQEAGGIVDEGAAFIQIVHADLATPEKKTAGAQSIQRPIGQRRDLEQSKLSRPSVHRPDDEEIDVQLKFRPLFSSATKGRLTITHGQRTLLTEQLDIASETRRQALLERLAQSEPRVSPAVVNARLSTLAELLAQDPGMWDGQRETGISRARLAGAGAEGTVLPQEFTDGRPPITTADAGRGLKTLHASPKGIYDLRQRQYGVMSDDLGFYGKFSTDDAGRISASNEARREPDSNETALISGKIEPAAGQEPKSLILPVKGLNIPFADVALHDGDRVIVERLREPLITVVGLVNRPGNFSYPPDVKYNLMHAMGFAGGLNLSAEPRYATIYRLAGDGTTVSATFNVAGAAKSLDLTAALSVPLKPYDVIAVEHTPRTRANVFWDRVFRFYISTYISPDDVFGEDWN